MISKVRTSASVFFSYFCSFCFLCFFRFRFCFFFCFLCIFPVTLYAGDLGTVGTTFMIKEPDFLRVLKARLQQLTQQGYLQKLQTAMRSQAKAYADRPTSVAGLSKTHIPRTWHIDPSITMPQTIRSPSGKVLVKAGTRYNPLHFIQLNETLVFYDGDDKDQIAWVRCLLEKVKNTKKTKKDKNTHQRIKLILVNGSLNAQNKLLTSFNQPIYFDQSGKLVQRFGIHHVPAVVKQDHLLFSVSEVVP